MWRNTEVLEFVEWLKAYNDAQPVRSKVGFYGLDLYSLHTSIHAVLKYLEKTDPAAAQRARSDMRVSITRGENSQRYGYTAAFQLSSSCENEVVAQLADLQRHTEQYLRRDGFVAEDELFYAEQNARLVTNAERYYRTMSGVFMECARPPYG